MSSPIFYSFFVSIFEKERIIKYSACLFGRKRGVIGNHVLNFVVQESCIPIALVQSCSIIFKLTSVHVKRIYKHGLNEFKWILGMNTNGKVIFSIDTYYHSSVLQQIDIWIHSIL